MRSFKLSEMNELFRIENVPDKGLGMITTQHIAQGTLILSEAAIFTMDFKATGRAARRKIDRELQKLSQKDRDQFSALHSCFESKGLMDRVRTNAFLLEPGRGTSEVGIFLTASRINHSCTPNAYHSFNTNSRQLTVFAIKDIPENTEITISYIDHLDYEKRRGILWERYRFTCDCELCEKRGSDRENSDNKFTYIQKVNDLLGEDTYLINPSDALDGMHWQMLALRAEGFGVGMMMAKVYFEASKLAYMHSDLARGKVFGERAIEMRAICLGINHPNVQMMGRFVERSKEQPKTAVWELGEDGIPTNLSEDSFEAWLWEHTKGLKLE